VLLGTELETDPAGNDGAIAGEVVDVPLPHQFFDAIVVGVVGTDGR